MALQPLAQEHRADARAVQCCDVAEAHEAREGAGQGGNEPLVGDGMVFQPEALHHQRMTGALQLEIGARDQPVLIKDWQGIVAPASLLLWLVNLPQILEVEERPGTSTGADDLQRGKKDQFVIGRGLDGAPLVGRAACVQRFE